MSNNPEFSPDEKELIKAAQLERVRAGSDMMLIHLGKTVLGQSETVHHKVEALPFTEHSIDQLYDLLEQRAIERADEQLTEGLALSFLNSASPTPPESSEDGGEEVSLPSVATPVVTAQALGKPKKKRAKKATETVHPSSCQEK